MTFEVLLAEEAEADISDIYRYVLAREGRDQAEALLTKLSETVFALSELPNRGNVPKELSAIGMSEFREVHYKPYRVIYRILDQQVVVYGVFDGRRDMQSLLNRRLMR